jgi:hypothetical protein
MAQPCVLRTLQTPGRVCHDANSTIGATGRSKVKAGFGPACGQELTAKIGPTETWVQRQGTVSFCAPVETAPSDL